MVALMTMFALIVPVVGAAPAIAAPSDDLECVPEQDQNPVPGAHDIDCYLLNQTDTGKVVRGEVISGPNDPDSTDGDSPESPDFTETSCTPGVDAPAGASDADGDSDDCRYDFDDYDGTAAGTDQLRFWVDDDSDVSTPDYDEAEGRDEAADPGNVQPEPDETEVVEKTWFTPIAANAALDCVDETDDEGDDDSVLNRNGESETYTCTLWEDTNGDGDQDAGEDGIDGVLLDTEWQGQNDPDNSGFGADSTVDFNNVATTDGSGEATFTASQNESQLGAAQICVWADEDNDTSFDAGGVPEDGGQCGEATSPDNSNQTDVVEKTWSAGGNPTTLDAEPEVDNNDTQTSHQITATVLDEFGDPVGAGTAVDFTIRAGSRNAAQGTVCPNVATNSSGVANCTYTDAGPDASGGDDTIQVNVDGAADAGEARATEDEDLTDVVFKRWTPGGPPAADEVLLDVEDGDANLDTVVCPQGGDYDQTATANLVGEMHEVCATAEDSTNTGIAGKAITFSISGEGFFTNEDGDNLGTSITVNADEAGNANALIASEDAGTSTVTASADGETDTGTKPWNPAPARNIDCDPDTDSNAPGTSHLVTCTVTDRFGNGVEDIDVDFSEEGAGRFESEEEETDADGEVEAVTTTTEEETGTQTITAEIAENTEGDPTTPGGTDDECEQAEGTPAGAPAGNCEDSVTKTWEEQPEEPPTVGSGPCRGFEQGSTQPNPASDNGGEIIVGTSGPDVIPGTDGDDVICGLGGNDIIDAGDGADIVVGNAGNDTINGDNGKDNLRGNKGRDVVNGGRGNDIVTGNKGDDTLRGNRGRDTLRGGPGADVLQGGRGKDILRGGKGRDTLRGFNGSDDLFGGGGRDRLRGGKGPDFLSGGPGNDSCKGGPGNDRRRSC